jgi:hypothetical protein
LKRAYPARHHSRKIWDNCHVFRVVHAPRRGLRSLLLQIASAQAQSQRNLILFVPDGLRALSVTPETAPAMAAVRVERFVERSKPGLSGLETILVGQRVGQTRYFDAAGFPGRTVGMEEHQAASR